MDAMPSALITRQQFADAMEIQRWQFAVNYAKYCPHYYGRLAWWIEPANIEWDADVPMPPVSFSDCARLIEEGGELMEWGKAKTVRRYLTVGNWRYWQMDPTWQECDLINRQELSLSTCKPVKPVTPRNQQLNLL